MVLRILFLMSPRFSTAATASAPQFWPLFQILEGQPVQDLFFAPEELEEVEVRFGASADDASWGVREEVHVFRRTISEQSEAPESRCLDRDVLQTAPSDAIG